MTPHTLFIEPSDVWLFRDSRPFATGERERAVSLFPPTPRTVQGAIRSARLAHSGEPFDYRRWSPTLQTEIGGPEDVGALRLRGPLLARREDQTVRPFFAHPQDVIKLDGMWRILAPRSNPQIVTNWPDGLLPLLPEADGDPDKFEPRWLSRDALLAYLGRNDRGLTLESAEKFFVHEPRLGIQVDSRQKRPPEGMLYQVEFMRLEENVGLLVEVDGLALPPSGLLQLGGEARAGRYTTVPEALDLPRQGRLNDAQRPLRFKLYLATPALFARGWLPDGIDANSLSGKVGNLPVQLIAAAVGKPQHVGGRDLTQRDRQRTLRRAVPAGSVYFFETHADAATVLGALDGKCLSETDTDAAIGFGLVYVGDW